MRRESKIETRALVRYQAVRSEWRLFCATHNLLKLFRSVVAKFIRRGMNIGEVPVYA